MKSEQDQKSDQGREQSRRRSSIVVDSTMPNNAQSAAAIKATSDVESGSWGLSSSQGKNDRVFALFVEESASASERRVFACCLEGQRELHVYTS